MGVTGNDQIWAMNKWRNQERCSVIMGDGEMQTPAAERENQEGGAH